MHMKPFGLNAIEWSTVHSKVTHTASQLDQWHQIERQRGTRQRDSPLSRLETPACGILCPAPRSAPSGHVPKKTLDHLLSHEQATESSQLSDRQYNNKNKNNNNHNNNNNKNLPDMIITLRSSLLASMRMSFLRDRNMDSESAFLFRGLFSMILLKDKHWWRRSHMCVWEVTFHNFLWWNCPLNC